MTEAAPPTATERARPAKPLPRWFPPLAAAALRTWGATWRLRSAVAPHLDPGRAERSSRCIYLFWHRTMLLACHTYRGCGACVGVSQHGDGEIGARIAERLGFKTARGSSTRGAMRLVRSMIEFTELEPGDLALTPDGPKGPSRQTKPGALYLAAHLGWPVVPLGFTARPRKELRTWDRFILPAPFARVGVVAAEPLVVERDASSERLAELCREIDRRMEAAERAAEELVA